MPANWTTYKLSQVFMLMEYFTKAFICTQTWEIERLRFYIAPDKIAWEPTKQARTKLALRLDVVQ